MARGYHDWLVAETAGALRTYSAVFGAPASMGGGVSYLSSLENPAASGVLLSIQRVFLYVTFITTGFNFEDAYILMERVSGPTGGTTLTPARHDTLDAASVAVFRRLPTAITAVLDSLLYWKQWWFLNTVAAADKAALLYPPIELYSHFADGRRQPWTLRPGEAMLITALPTDPAILGFGSLTEYTEEPLG